MHGAGTRDLAEVIMMVIPEAWQNTPLGRGPTDPTDPMDPLPESTEWQRGFDRMFP